MQFAEIDKAEDMRDKLKHLTSFKWDVVMTQLWLWFPLKPRSEGMGSSSSIAWWKLEGEGCPLQLATGGMETDEKGNYTRPTYHATKQKRTEKWGVVLCSLISRSSRAAGLTALYGHVFPFPPLRIIRASLLDSMQHVMPLIPLSVPLALVSLKSATSVWAIPLLPICRIRSQTA